MTVFSSIKTTADKNIGYDHNPAKPRRTRHTTNHA